MAPRMKVETSADQPTSQAVNAAPKKASTAVPKPAVTPAPKPVSVPTSKPMDARVPKVVDSAAEAPAPKSASTSVNPSIPRLVETPVHAPASEQPEQHQPQHYAYEEATDSTPTPDSVPVSDSAQEQRQDHAQGQSSTHGQTAKQKRDFGDMRRAASGWVHRTFPGNEHAFWGGVIALVVAVLVFVIGLPRMLFICLLVVVGVAIGQIADGDPKIIRAITSLFKSERDQS